jgi:uncharacterized protein YihD (DUF1040 family)
MRRPERIERLLNLLYEIWSYQPDTRFNQLIHNLQIEYAENNGYLTEVWDKDEHKGIVSYRQKHIADLFNLEDDKFIEFLIDKRNKL